MKIIFIVSVISLVCYFTPGVSGATATGKIDCTPGQVWADNCVKHTCGDDGRVTYDSCGVVSCGGPGVERVEDPSKPYPDCCPKCVVKKL